MCGIAGQVLTGGRPVTAAAVQAMGDALRHRGPDDEGLHVDGHVGFAHRRLSVLDLSPAGRQPMSNETGTVWIVFNGEIYNFRELRAGLESRHAFRSQTDTEVVLHLYEEHGVACLPMLRGMFAFALWDAPRQRLLLARDRLGKKPLFYRHDRHGLAFASELKALFLGHRPEVDPVALHHYLTFQYVPAPWTIAAGVRKLPPAHYLLYEEGKVTEQDYWTLRYDDKLRGRSDHDLQDEFTSLLEDCVRLRLASDVPLGAFLSGGVDSSAVVALMSRLSDRPVKTFSIGFQEDAFNELPFARMVAERFKTEHHEEIVRPDALSILPKLVRVYDEPYADSSAIPTYHLSEITRRHVTVALNGDGGDELFAGYPRYARRPWESLRARWTRGGISRFSGRYLSRICYFSPAEKRALYAPAFAARVAPHDDSDVLLRRWFETAQADNLLDAVLSVDTRSYLSDDLLVKVDRATMAHGLEARSPFLDHRLVEFAAALPTRLKAGATGAGKILLKRAMRGILPDAILDRPKMGFGVPIDTWFRGDCCDYVRETLLSARARQRGYFTSGAIEAIVDAHQARRGNFGYRLYALLMLELWHREFVDGEAA